MTFHDVYYAGIIIFLFCFLHCSDCLDLHSHADLTWVVVLYVSTRLILFFFWLGL